MMRTTPQLMSNLTINRIKPNKSTEETWATCQLFLKIIIMDHSRCKFKNRYPKVIIVVKNNTMAIEENEKQRLVVIFIMKNILIMI